MKNVFKQIKLYISDHKDYFIRCTFNAVIVGVIIGIVCAVVSVPASAEASSTIIEAGTYRFNDDLDLITDSGNINYSANLPFIVTPDFSVVDNSVVLGSGNVAFNGITVNRTNSGAGSNVVFIQSDSTEQLIYSQMYVQFGSPGWAGIASSIIEQHPNVDQDSAGLLFGWGQTITIPVDTEVDDTFAVWFNAHTTVIGGNIPGEPTTSTIAAGTYFGVEVPSPASFNVSFSFTSDSYEFDTFYVGSDHITYRMLTGDVRSVNAFDFTSDLWSINYETITVPTDQTLPADFVTWFNANYTTQITPDPEPTYTIQAGYYKARDTFSTSGWNASNDSIRIRYYNDAANVQAYEVVDGITFLRHNDAVEIYYSDKSVFTDGWNINGAKNIQVMQDVIVGSDFYTVFNNVYAPSSESSNEFDSGYAAGYVDGRNDGYDSGYNQGYAQGLADGDQNIFTNIIGGTLGALDGFTIIGGFSLLDLISTLLGGMALVWILKLLAGG